MINVDKAYIFGLVIGGGVFGRNLNSFSIILPYRQWGSLATNSQRASLISRDIAKIVFPLFSITYGISVSYNIQPMFWEIVCSGDLSKLSSDFNTYGIELSGEIKKNVSLTSLAADLIDDNLKRRFVAGLVDTIGSTNQNHRRFSDDVQILSFEISGFNYNFVMDLCKILYSIKCFPDQILWNHPNFHSSMNSYYKSWKKGFKLRVTLDQYSKFGAFSFQTKAESAKDNLALERFETNSVRCETRVLNIKESTVHSDEGSLYLPECIRDGHYFHNKHVCAVLGCPHAPYQAISDAIMNAHNLVNPFPILVQDNAEKINDLVRTSPIMNKRNYRVITVDIELYYSIFQSSSNELLFGNGLTCGYPIHYIIRGISYILAALKGKTNGNRIIGNFLEYIVEEVNSIEQHKITMLIPELLTPLIITDHNFSAMIGPRNPEVYKKLISTDPSNKFKIHVRQINESDL